MSQPGYGEDDNVLVLPALPDDPVFVDAVEDALSGAVEEMPEAQPQRPVGVSASDFASLYVRHRSSFAVHARRFLHDQRDIDEVLQEAFLRLFLAMPELECELQALSYCRRTITNLCIDRYRADQRRPRLVDLDTLDFDPCDEAVYDDPVLRAEDAAIVREALALLSPMHRAALVKREVEEKPLPQIAAELEIPEESVKHLLYRARRALRRLLVGTSVEPGIDLGNMGNRELLRLANERLGRATLRSGNVLIVLFVITVTVVGGLRGVSPSDRIEGSGELSPAVTPGVVGSAGNPVHPSPAAPSRSPRHHARHQAAPPEQPAVAPPAPRSAVEDTKAAPRRIHRVHIPTRAPIDPATQGPAPGTFTIDAPTLGVVGDAAVRTTTVELKPTGAWASTSDFVAPTATGDFTLNQVVEKSTEGVVSANVDVDVPTADSEADISTLTSDVTTSPTVDGNVLVNVELTVASSNAGSPATASAQPGLHIDIQAVYTPDVTRVLAETVSVVEGSAPCCDSPATSTPPSSPSDSDVMSPSLETTAVSAASVSPMSPTKRDDQQPVASS